MKVYRVRKETYQQKAGAETLAAIAHDLRSPMSCVCGAAQMALIQSRQGRGVDEQMKQILTAIESMDRMLDGMCSMKPAQRTLEQLKAALETMALRAQGKKLSIDMGNLHDQALPENGAALERILLNLIGNAVKYTPEGGEIRVTGGIQEEYAVFCIEDNGMGMKPEFVKRMFEPFARAQTSSHIPGMGLGLTIVRRLLRQMGGTIDVKSEWEKGTVFTVYVPSARSGLQ